ncbi:unnamed protein product [Mytilus edulis]|uniref:C2H2-type domain-containing protein n=1 Tax=Mytilus edulis TaxID=6550 RepID=A0A8S3RQK5_MYTED|nr:unnamed protein product [Mytilus edulis]
MDKLKDSIVVPLALIKSYLCGEKQTGTLMLMFSRCLPINSNESTGLTPNLLMLGRDIRLPLEMSTYSYDSNKAVRRATVCLRCPEEHQYQGPRFRVIIHILLKHVEITQVPYYCLLCGYKTTKESQLKAHPAFHQQHIKQREEAMAARTFEGDNFYFRKSEQPYQPKPEEDYKLMSTKGTQQDPISCSSGEAPLPKRGKRRSLTKDRENDKKKNNWIDIQKGLDRCVGGKMLPEKQLQEVIRKMEETILILFTSCRKEEEKRVTPQVEEPVATNPCESLVVLVFHNTRKLVAVTSVAQARDLFDLEDQEVVLAYLGAELTRSVRKELLPAISDVYDVHTFITFMKL